MALGRRKGAQAAESLRNEALAIRLHRRQGFHGAADLAALIRAKPFHFLRPSDNTVALVGRHAVQLIQALAVPLLRRRWQVMKARLLFESSLLLRRRKIAVLIQPAGKMLAILRLLSGILMPLNPIHRRGIALLLRGCRVRLTWIRALILRWRSLLLLWLGSCVRLRTIGPLILLLRDLLLLRVLLLRSSIRLTGVGALILLRRVALLLLRRVALLRILPTLPLLRRVWLRLRLVGRPLLIRLLP